MKIAVLRKGRAVLAFIYAAAHAQRWPEKNFMLDDIAEGVSKTIFKGISRFVFEILIEIFLFYTGEIVLYILALGHKKPRWNYYENKSPSKWVICTEISTWIGIAFWLFVAWFINSVFFN